MVEDGRIGLAKVIDDVVPGDVLVDGFYLGITVGGLNPLT